MTRFEVGELVDVTVRGARVDGYVDNGDLVYVLNVRGEETFYQVATAPSVTVTRVAPKEWPPQLGDVWRDRAAARWFARRGHQDGSVPTMVCSDGRTDTLVGLLERNGPLTLAYREGWTPAPAVEREGRASAPVDGLDERAAIIAGIRQFADLIEANPDLPASRYDVRAQVHVRNMDHVTCDEDGFVELRRIAAILGVEPYLTDGPDAPHPNATLVLSGGINYEAIYVTDAYKRGYDARNASTVDPSDGGGEAGPVEHEAAGPAGPAHQEVEYWRDGDGEWGVLCSCDARFEGFDSHGDASAELERHASGPADIDGSPSDLDGGERIGLDRRAATADEITAAALAEEPITDAAGYLPCGCHGGQREHSCKDQLDAERGDES